MESKQIFVFFIFKNKSANLIILKSKEIKISKLVISCNMFNYTVPPAKDKTAKTIKNSENLTKIYFFRAFCFYLFAKERNKFKVAASNHESYPLWLTLY